MKRYFDTFDSQPQTGAEFQSDIPTENVNLSSEGQNSLTVEKPVKLFSTTK